MDFRVTFITKIVTSGVEAEDKKKLESIKQIFYNWKT